MRVLVTGAAGFIGRHLVARLLELDHEVVAIDDLSHSRYASSIEYQKANPDVEFFWTDVADAECLHSYRSIFASSWDRPKTIDCIFHLAAVSRTPAAINDPVNCWQTNVTGTVRTLQVARENGVQRVVCASSNVVYAADTPYKASKIAVEEVCNIYANMFNLSCMSLRFSNVYGSGMMRGDEAVFAKLRDTALSKYYIEITGDGEQSRSFTHVSDIVEGLILSSQSEYRGALDLCTGVNTTLNQVAPMIQAIASRITNSPIAIRHIADRVGDIKHIVQDPEPAEAVLGWKAKIAIEDGIKDVFAL